MGLLGGVVVRRDDSAVVVELQGLDRVWSLKGRIRIPVEHVVEARVVENARRLPWRGWRLPGTNVPGLLTAGTYLRRGSRSFWDIRRGRRALVLELKDEPYDRVVVEVDDPEATVAALAGPRRRK